MKNEILQLARRYDVVQNIMSHINEKTLMQAYWSQPDTATKELYGKNLEENIQKLLQRMKKFSYFFRKRSGSGKDLEHEFRLLEDAILQHVFTIILKQIYTAKNPVILSPKDGRFQNVERVIYQYVWRTKFRVLYKEADLKKLTGFLGQYISDKNFMRYIKRFLESRIMENQTLHGDELESDESLASILMKIYCYHILREWLCSKGDNLRGKVHLSFHKEYFYFRTNNMRDLFKICNGLVDDQEQTGLQITSSTYIEDVFGKLRRNSQKVYFSSRNRHKIERRTL